MATTPDYKNIQGDIWPGLTKKYQQFWFFQITDPAAFKPSLGKLVADKVITSSEDAIETRKHIKKFKEKNPGALQDLAAVNIAFTFKAMKLLWNDDDGFRDDPFRKGQEGDMAAEGRDRVEEWMKEFTANTGGVHGVFWVCGTEKKVKETTEKVAKTYFNPDRGIKHVVTIDGKERPGENAKHEHFGFLDNISQPRLKGFDDPPKDGDGNYKFMCRPGRIIIGYDGEMENEPKLQHPAWAKNGSYLVFRKYQQFVPEFNNYLKTESKKLGLSEGQLGAKLLGRWKSGAPVELHPNEDCPSDARMNDFNYDPKDASRCPFASHMRKVKPRGEIHDRDMNDIVRRGIPYGPELGANETKTEVDRGLIFTCFQSSISNGFQFLQRSWINLDTFPPDKNEYIGGANPGQDVIVGQLVKKPQKKEHLYLKTAICDGQGNHTTTTFKPFIQSQGGDYFFAPSLQLLRDIGGQ